MGHQADERNYTPAVLILRDLGVRSIRLLTNNPAKVESLQRHQLPVIERVAMQSSVNRENVAYLRAKVQRMRHLLDLNGHLNDHINDHFGGAPDSATHTAAAYEPLLNALEERAAAHFAAATAPFVTLSYAQSLDGCLAAQSGQPLALSAPESMRMTHALRAAHNAILIGIGTALADDPSLTVRLVQGANPQPIVVDSHLRLPVTAQLLQAARPVWIATTEAAPLERQQALEAVGVGVLRLPATPAGQVDLGALLQRLGAFGIRSLMVEGGPTVLTSFLSARLAHYSVVTVAPVFVGGLHAVIRPLHTALTALPRLENPRVLPLGPDVTLWGALV